VLWIEREFEERSRDIETLARASVAPVDGKTDEACAVCGEGSGLRWGAFLGGYTLNLGPEILVWEWEMERGSMVFVADTRGKDADAEISVRYSLDADRRIPYCSMCADEATSDRGLPPGTRVTAFSS
jgi:hypothetical protein